MAGLTKHPNSPFWTAIYYDGAGRKYRKSTKEANQKKAQLIADKWEKVARLGASKQLTEANARKVVAEILEQYTGEQMPFFSVKGWIEEFLEGRKSAGRADALQKYTRVGQAFAGFLEERADYTIAGVTPKDIRLFREKLRGNRSPGTVNQLMRKLSAIFWSAHQHGYISANPCVGLLPLDEDADACREPFTTEQVCALIAAAEGDWIGAVLFGYYTGLRLSDIVNLDWKSIDLDKGALTVRPSKTKRTKKTLMLPLHENLTEWLRGRAQGGFVFPSLAGKRTSGKEGLSTQFAKIMHKAGITGRKLRESPVGRTMWSLSFHSLRHTMVSAMANAKVSADIRKKLSGHSSDSSHQIYTHHEIQTMREAINCLPSVTAKKPTTE